MEKVSLWFINNRRKITAGLVVWALMPLAIFALPVDYIIQHPHSICLFKNITGHDCPSCGLTRATLLCMHFRYSEAFMFNKLIVAVFPLLMYIWWRNFYKQIKLIDWKKPENPIQTKE
jgi:hypothetical protein